MEEIKVEKGIPLDRGAHRYPFAKLEVGDSFFIPGISIGGVSFTRKRAEHETGFKFTCRTVDGGVRVWRIR